jgi:hypothetical protein
MQPHLRWTSETIMQTILMTLMAAFTFLSAGCVSVNLKPKTAQHSIDYKYLTPDSSFQKIESEQTDLAWQNQKSGNTIAVLTECSETADPSLTDLEADMTQVLNESKVVKTENLMFEEREALRSMIEGKVDGIAVKLDVLTFKKNSCSYTLTYMGRAQGFEKDHSAFDSFVKGFKVQ